ncbi:uncharacterized protein LOC134260255 [Saccostrea cucullata]|uniref:uncharacterized protein LOC134260255 n=1 Tax=Saccostrea cuccullata TaxID=36930 RepID=UPI002ED3A73E
MSDYGFIDNHRELKRLLSNLDVDSKNCEHSVRYKRGEITNDLLKSFTGHTIDLDELSATETDSFQYGDDVIFLLEAFNEGDCYVCDAKSDRITARVNKKGEKTQTFSINPYDTCVCETGDVYFTNYENNSIARLSTTRSYMNLLSYSGSFTTVICTDPLTPLGICQSLDGGLLVTLIDMESEDFKLEATSRRLLRHIALNGDIIKEYKYLEDKQTRLFIQPVRVVQNKNSQICVVNRTSGKTGELVVISPSGRPMFIYCGQDLIHGFNPNDVVCDSLCNIIVADAGNHLIHLLSPDGDFLKYLLTDNEVKTPTSLSLSKRTLWVGNEHGLVKVFKYMA